MVLTFSTFRVPLLRISFKGNLAASVTSFFVKCRAATLDETLILLSFPVLFLIASHYKSCPKAFSVTPHVYHKITLANIKKSSNPFRVIIRFSFNVALGNENSNTITWHLNITSSYIVYSYLIPLTYWKGQWVTHASLVCSTCN